MPAATGGDGALSYALSPGLPPELAFDSSALRVSGTPTEAMGPTERAAAAVTAPILAVLTAALALHGQLPLR